MPAGKRRAAGIGIAIAGGGLAVAHSLPALMPLVPGLARAIGVPLGLPGTAAAGSVAITFDDGPHPEGTPEVLRILDEQGVKATFFLVGERVEAAPGLTAEIAAAGHRIALHCHRHRNALPLTGRQIHDDIERARDVIHSHTGIECDLQRAPLGIYTTAFLREVLAAGLRPQLWTQWGRDWRAAATPGSIVEDATATLREGDVILLHDGDDYSAEGSHRRTVAALPAILDAVKTRNLEAVALP